MNGTTIRTGLTADEIKQAFRDNLVCGMGRLEATATKHDLYVALALTVRDRLFQRSVTSMENYGGTDARRVAYLSAEFLLGPHLANNLLNLGITEAAREAMRGLGYDLDEIIAQEEEPGLGNGGLGRLAACYMDSLASVEVPAVGYGIRYEFGIFDQSIRDGWQCEITDKWLKNGNQWEIARPETTYPVKFRRAHRGLDRTSRVAIACAGFRRPKCAASPTTRRSPATASRRATRCAVESRGHRVVRLRGIQPERLRPARRGQGRERDDLESPLSPMTRRIAARSCGSSSSSFSRAARCRTCCASTRCSAARPRPSTKSGPCSSMTRTRRSPSPS
jgi:glucan phosphorylase